MLIQRIAALAPVVFGAIIITQGTSTLRAGQVSAFQAGQGGWQLGTIAVGNIDGDAQLEIIVPYRDTTGPRTVWHLNAFKPDGTQVTGFPYRGGEQPINLSPTLFDLNGDGRSEILFSCGPEMIALRGDGSTVWKTPVTYQNYVPDAGYQVVTNGFYWSENGAWRDRLPSTAEFFSEVSSPIVADVDGTGALTVMTAWKILPDNTSTWQDYNPFIRSIYGFGDWGTVGDVWSGGVVFFDAITGKKEYVYHIHQLIESGLGLGRSRPGEGPLIYVLNDSDSVVAFDKRKPYGHWGNEMLYKQFGKNQRLQSGSYLKGVDIYPADLDGDGEDELLVPTTQVDPLWQPCETILDNDGAILWRQWKEVVDVPVRHGWLNNACMIPINPDGDNRIDVLSFTHSYEIAFRSWNGIELADRPGWPKSFHPCLPTPPVVGDVDGDGHEEIVVGTYDPAANPSNGSLYVFALDGTEKFRLAVPGGLKHIPTLADANGDGSLDVIYRALDGRVFIQNFGATSSSRVSWATHRGNMSRDGNRGVALFPEGTPIIVQKESGFRRTRFTWRTPEGKEALRFQIFRADQAEGPYQPLATVAGSVRAFSDAGLRDGCLYFYEVRAVYNTGIVASAPFAILPLANGNLIGNAGFEENDNNRWDKWFTGEIPWQNMTGSGEQPFQGRQCMEVKLNNHGSNSSIKQANQYGTPDPAIRTTAGRFYSFGGWLRSGGLSEPSKHWLEWNTTRTGENTNAIPPAPWPLYFTPHVSFDTQSTPWIYANRVFTMPEGFPNIELRHRFTAAKPGSGSVFLDNVFFRELPPLADPRWHELSPFSATWSYTSSEPPADWHLEGFDSSGWPQARAKFGGGTGTRDVVTPLPLMRPAYYFRREFTVPEGAWEELLLAATATDDFDGRTYPLRVYLNGQELGANGIDAVTGDGTIPKYFDLLPFIDVLRPGVNTIAVMVQNGWAKDWDNVAFDLSLKAVPSSSPAPARFSIQAKQDGSFTLRITGPAGSSWAVETAESPEASALWQKVQSITLDAGGTAIREWKPETKPHLAGSRFYRLVPE